MSRRPGYHLLYEDEIEPCLFCGGSGRIYISRDGKAVIECTHCGIYTFAYLRKDEPYEETRKKLIAFWNNDESWIRFKANRSL